MLVCVFFFLFHIIFKLKYSAFSNAIHESFYNLHAIFQLLIIPETPKSARNVSFNLNFLCFFPSKEFRKKWSCELEIDTDWAER